MPDPDTPGMPCQKCGRAILDIMDIILIRVPGVRPWRICRNCFNYMWKMSVPDDDLPER